MADKRVKGEWNPVRLLQAIGRIGYSPVAALLDITDNAVSAHATEIRININVAAEKERAAGRPRSTISSFEVADNGDGMSEQGIWNALTLGSSNKAYEAGTLSKFGLGLKSAAFSLGKRLTILSKEKSGEITKAVLDFDLLAMSNEPLYEYSISELTESERTEFTQVCGDSGTIIRVDKLNSRSLPSYAQIESQLIKRARVCYYYFITGKVPNSKPLKLKVNGSDIEPLDPLFEAEVEGNLDEKTWDGISVRWITAPTKIQLSVDSPDVAEVAVVQLPHPPSVEFEQQGKRSETRDRYEIGAGNYGFYIYRSYRLIGWGERLGIIPQEKELYGFRGRINFHSGSDDVLNIDVAKSNIQLSELAFDQLEPQVKEAVKKSRAAWTTRTSVIKAYTDEGPKEELDEALSSFEDVERKQETTDEAVVSEPERQELKKRRETAEQVKTTDEESLRLKEKKERIQFVDYLDNNKLWERAHDPQHGLIVRVSRAHRFYREVINVHGDNSVVIKILGVLLYGLARGEFETVYRGSLDAKAVEKTLEEYKERTGTVLSEIMRSDEVSRLFGTEK